jgi:hypothetical protein
MGHLGLLLATAMQAYLGQFGRFLCDHAGMDCLEMLSKPSRLIFLRLFEISARISAFRFVPGDMGA